MLKKIGMLLPAVALVFGLVVGCGNGDDPATGSSYVSFKIEGTVTNQSDADVTGTQVFSIIFFKTATAGANFDAAPDTGSPGYGAAENGAATRVATYYEKRFGETISISPSATGEAANVGAGFSPTNLPDAIRLEAGQNHTIKSFTLNRIIWIKSDGSETPVNVGRTIEILTTNYAGANFLFELPDDFVDEGDVIIEDFEIGGIVAPVDGNTPITGEDITISMIAAGYTVESAVWADTAAESTWDPESDTFVKDGVYRLTIVFRTEAPFVFEGIPATNFTAATLGLTDKTTSVSFDIATKTLVIVFVAAEDAFPTATAPLTVVLGTVTPTSNATIAMDGTTGYTVTTTGENGYWGVNASFLVNFGTYSLANYTRVVFDYEGISGDVAWKDLRLRVFTAAPAGWVSDNDTTIMYDTGRYQTGSLGAVSDVSLTIDRLKADTDFSGESNLWVSLDMALPSSVCVYKISNIRFVID